MTMLPKLTASLLLGAAATFAPAGFAAEVVEVTTVNPNPTLAEYYYAPAPATTHYYTPTVTEVYEAPRVTVIAPPLTEDEAITEDVMDVLAHDRRLSGRIGVETHRNTVTLSGRVLSSRQIDLAESDARSVPGVRDVNNELRPLVGGMR